MIDIHNHLLYGIDDGAKTLEDSLKVLKEMSSYGYTDIILTPHYIVDSKYNNKKDDNIKRMNILKEKLKEESIPLNLYLGNETFIDDKLLKYIELGYCATLNDTKFILIELPLSGEYEAYKEILSEMINKGYKVILAHPERYISFQNDFNRVYELERIGVLFQSNIDSIIGGYGSNAKKMVKRLLKEHKLSFLATDAHRRKNPDNFIKAHKRALRYISEEYYQKLVEGNASKLLKTKVMETI